MFAAVIQPNLVGAAQAIIANCRIQITISIQIAQGNADTERLEKNVRKVIADVEKLNERYAERVALHDQVGAVVGVGAIAVRLTVGESQEAVLVADAEGDVIERTLFVTRILTPKNVEIAIPNSMVLANHICTRWSIRSKTWSWLTTAMHLSIS